MLHIFARCVALASRVSVYVCVLCRYIIPKAQIRRNYDGTVIDLASTRPIDSDLSERRALYERAQYRPH